MSELQQLRDRVAELEDLLGVARALRTPPANIVLTRREEQIAELLLANKVVNEEIYRTALFSLRPDCDAPEWCSLSVYACRLRKKLKPHGIAIGTWTWGSASYFLTQDNRQKLAALLAERL